MLKIDITTPGLEGISRELRKFPGALEKFITDVTKRVRSAIVEGTPVDTGEARASWGPIKKNEGGLSFQSTVPYMLHLEKGSTPGEQPWPTPGPKTVMQGGKIYSSQAPGGIVATANVDAIMDELVKKFIDEAFG